MKDTTGGVPGNVCMRVWEKKKMQLELELYLTF